MTTQTVSVADRLIDAMRDADWEAVARTYAADVLLDMNLPTWRFQRQGAGEVGEYFRQNTAQLRNLRCTYLHESAITDTTTVVESECRFDGDGGEYLWRCVDIFTVAEDRISRHVQYCTGCWTPADIARQTAEAPMVAW